MATANIMKRPTQCFIAMEFSESDDDVHTFAIEIFMLHKS